MVKRAHDELVQLDIPDPQTGEVVDSDLVSRVAFAEKLIEQEFSLLHGQTILAMWGQLEACIDDICVARLASHDLDKQAEALASLKVPLGEFLVLSEESKWPWVLGKLKSLTNSSLRAGIGQFDSILKSVGIDVPIDPDIRTLIYLVKSVRNALAHRGGRADAQFCADVPGWGIEVGSPIRLTQAHTISAVVGMAMYVSAVMREALGQTAPSSMDKEYVPAAVLANFQMAAGGADQ